MSEMLRIGEIRTVDATKHIRERSNAETEGFESAPMAIGAYRTRMNPGILMFRSAVSVRSVGFDSWQKGGS